MGFTVRRMLIVSRHRPLIQNKDSFFPFLNSSQFPMPCRIVPPLLFLSNSGALNIIFLFDNVLCIFRQRHVARLYEIVCICIILEH